jgi:Insecticide toxin TcdB middle/N-terminal region
VGPPQENSGYSGLGNPKNSFFEGKSCTGDFDGDGRTDVLIRPYAQPNTFAVYLSRSNSFQAVPISLAGYTTKAPLICADFDGNGLTDVFYNGQYHYNTLPVAPDALKSTSNGLGHYYSVEYKSTTDNSVYTKYSGEVLPRVDLQTPIPVVSYVTDNAGVGPVRTRYQYYGLKADLKRRGTLGFAAVQSVNEGTNPNTINTTWYNQTWPLIGMKATQQKHLALGASNRLLENTVYAYKTNAIGNPAAAATALGAQVELNQINATQYDANDGSLMGSTTDNFAGIDALGNVGVQTHQELDASGSLTSQRITTNTYTINTANWLIGQVSSSKTTSTNLRSLPITMVGASAGADAASQSGQPPPPPVVPLTLAQKAAMAVISNLLLAD